MSSFICLKGILLISNSVAFADGSWDLTDVVLNVQSVTDGFTRMGGDGWMINLAAANSATFSWTTKLDNTDGIDLDSTIGETHIIVFNTKNGPSYSGDVILDSADITAETDTISTVAWTATLDGVLTEDIST